MWLVGANQILSAPGKADSAVPLLAFKLGGTLLLGIVAAVAFATILAVVAGLTITASASFAHDVYAGVLRRHEPEPSQEVRVARIAAVVIGMVAVIGGIYAKDVNVAFLSRWHSRSPRPRTCRRSCIRCSGLGSPPAARCGASTAG